MTSLPAVIDELRSACIAADGVDPFQHAELLASAVAVATAPVLESRLTRSTDRSRGLFA